MQGNVHQSGLGPLVAVKRLHLIPDSLSLLKRAKGQVIAEGRCIVCVVSDLTQVRLKFKSQLVDIRTHLEINDVIDDLQRRSLSTTRHYASFQSRYRKRPRTLEGTRQAEQRKRDTR